MLKGSMVLAYILLVGLPLLLLLTILRAGRHLEAPVSVSGAWTVTADTAAIHDPRCQELLAGIQQPFVDIAQSGGKLIFNVNDRARTTIPGEIRNSHLSMLASGDSGKMGSCTDTTSLYLDAIVAKQGSGRTMTGVLGIRGCDACAPISFRAVREARMSNGGE